MVLFSRYDGKLIVWVLRLVLHLLHFSTQSLSFTLLKITSKLAENDIELSFTANYTILKSKIVLFLKQSAYRSEVTAKTAKNIH